MKIITHDMLEVGVTYEIKLTADNNISIRQKKSKSIFTPPTLDEVRRYCYERNNKVDAENFIDFYESKGWKVGNAKMKDWRASVRTWEKRIKQNTQDANAGIVTKEYTKAELDNLYKVFEELAE